MRILRLWVEICKPLDSFPNQYSLPIDAALCPSLSTIFAA